MLNMLVLPPEGRKYSARFAEAGGDECRWMYLPADASKVQRQALIDVADVIIGFPSVDEIQSASRLKWIQLSWSGTDIYTMSDRFPKSVQLTCATGAYGVIIAEHVLAFILGLSRRFPEYFRQQQNRGWTDLGYEYTLEGKRVLILGAGDIGCAVARLLSGFQTTNVGIRRSASVLPEFFSEMYTLDSLDSQLPLADIVVCCLPSTRETVGLFDRQRLLRMKENAMLVNVGRGTLIVTKDLEDIMAAGHLAGAGLDVTAPEPLPADSPLWDMKNVIITPHIAGVGFGHCERTEERVVDICCENVRRFLQGVPLLNTVDFQKGYRAEKTYPAQRSCGAILYRQTATGIQYLLLFQCGSQTWSFPKGHMEATETERETALREVVEETGLTVELESGFRRTMEYEQKVGGRKAVTLFLAKASGVPVIKEDEIEQCAWVDRETAVQLLSGRPAADILLEAERFILNKK
jgi:phosphoglycerate dehydrogenase-like enzyme/8-oxo-dGTP pyrophosphatase MutT (NUDIX family)